MSVGTCRWLKGVPVRALTVRRQGRQRYTRYPNAVVRSSACVASPWQYGQPIIPSSIHRYKRSRIGKGSSPKTSTAIMWPGPGGGR